MKGVEISFYKMCHVETDNRNCYYKLWSRQQEMTIEERPGRFTMNLTGWCSHAKGSKPNSRMHYTCRDVSLPIWIDMTKQVVSMLITCRNIWNKVKNIIWLSTELQLQVRKDFKLPVLPFPMPLYIYIHILWVCEMLKLSKMRNAFLCQLIRMWFLMMYMCLQFCSCWHVLFGASKWLFWGS